MHGNLAVPCRSSKLQQIATHTPLQESLVGTSVRSRSLLTPLVYPDKEKPHVLYRALIVACLSLNQNYRARLSAFLSFISNTFIASRTTPDSQRCIEYFQVIFNTQEHFASSAIDPEFFFDKCHACGVWRFR